MDGPFPYATPVVAITLRRCFALRVSRVFLVPLASWNGFDFLVAVTSLIDVIVTSASQEEVRPNKDSYEHESALISAQPIGAAPALGTDPRRPIERASPCLTPRGLSLVQRRSLLIERDP